MESINIRISNCFNLTINSHTYNFYNTDKFVYIILNKIPSSDLTCKFVNIFTDNFIDITIDTISLKNTLKKYGVPFCTVPIISLYNNRTINEWKLFISDSNKKNPLIRKFNLIVKINENFITGKPIFISELCCGIFLEKTV